MSGSFHPNSDADRLYSFRKDGGRGIGDVKTMHESRIISIRQHLRNIKDKSEIHEYVHESWLATSQGWLRTITSK